MQTLEINGFVIDEFNIHKLEEGKEARYMPCTVPTIENPKIKRLSVRLTIGNGVSVLVIIVIHHFNYIRINAKAKLKRFMLNLNQLLYLTSQVQK
jgi:hypothetical protein